MNLDSTGLRIVKRGAVVEYGGLRGLVMKMGKGNAWVLFGQTLTNVSSNLLTVV